VYRELRHDLHEGKRAVGSLIRVSSRSCQISTTSRDVAGKPPKSWQQASSRH